MKTTHSPVRSTVLAGHRPRIALAAPIALALALALAGGVPAAHGQAQSAQPGSMSPGMHDPRASGAMQGQQGAGMSMMHEQHHGAASAQRRGDMLGQHGGAGLGRMLQGLSLDEAQRDRIFSITHAAEPALREKGKAVQAARQQLAAVAMSPEYDAARARAAAEQLARATAEMAELRARTQNEVFRTLTPEQQKQLQERRNRMHSHGMSPGHRHLS